MENVGSKTKRIGFGRVNENTVEIYIRTIVIRHCVDDKLNICCVSITLDQVLAERISVQIVKNKTWQKINDEHCSCWIALLVTVNDRSTFSYMLLCFTTFLADR